MKTRLLLAVVACALPLTVLAKSPVAPLKTEQAQLGYAIGFQIGHNLKEQGLTKIDTRALTQAVQDVITGAKTRLTPGQMQTVVMKFQRERHKKQVAEAKKNLKTGKAFQAAFKKKGAVELPDGLQYKVLRKGKGPKPTAADTVVVNYRGILPNGTVFDSSYKRGKPAEIPVGRVIPGWQEVLKRMPVGSKWQVVIPPKLAYGAKGAGNAIGPNQTLMFDIELLSIKKAGTHGAN
jgi:FKBP-type peptidyl-prolyl cis-trans isomerase FklB